MSVDAPRSSKPASAVVVGSKRQLPTEGTVRYMLSIYIDPTADTGAEMSEWWALNEALEKAGAFRAGDALEAPSTATTVRLRGGERLLTDGPFAETKEQLGGFYIVEAKDLDEALSWAERVPSLKHYGAVEVRPIVEFPDRPPANGAVAEQAAS
jgi:hypothetical protein